MKKFPLSGKAVLITGGSGGLGEALSLEAARRGARLGLISRDLKATEAVAKRAREMGSPWAKAYRLDLTQPAQLKVVVRRIEREMNGVDLAVNNAGIHFFSDIEQIPEATFKVLLDTNLFAPLRMIQALLPGMKERGSGMIVNIGSTLGLRSIPGAGGYAASKAALERLSESLRMELAASGVRVLHASPGVVLTRLRERALVQGAPPAPSSSLPFPRTARRTAVDILDAVEAGKSRLVSAAWPVRFFMGFLNTLAPGFVDRRLSRSVYPLNTK